MSQVYGLAPSPGDGGEAMGFAAYTPRLPNGIPMQGNARPARKVGMGAMPATTPPSQPCMSQNRVVAVGEEASDRPSLVLRLLRQVRGEAKIGVSSFLVTVLCKPERLDGCTPD